MSGIATAIVGSAVVGAVASSKASSKAAKTASEGSERDIAFQRESRDLARADQKPYREAGYTALDALMSMTGLGGGAAAPVRQRPRGPLFRRNPDLDIAGGSPRMSARGSSFGRRYALRYAGGPLEQNQMYNINELAPENVYSGGAVTRNPNPMTIDGRTGYVEGRAYGGYMNESGVLGGAYKPTPPWGHAPPIGPPESIPPPNNVPRGSYPRENPGGVEGGYQFQTEPGYQFRFEEGQRALDRGAAARGGLLSGGYGRKAIRYGQGFASNEYANVYNRIANIAGLGQTGATTSGNAALYAGQGMGTAASNAANATAYGQIGVGNAWANAGNQMAQVPWDQIPWGGGGGGSSLQDTLDWQMPQLSTPWD